MACTTLILNTNLAKPRNWSIIPPAKPRGASQRLIPNGLELLERGKSRTARGTPVSGVFLASGAERASGLRGGRAATPVPGVLSVWFCDLMSIQKALSGRRKWRVARGQPGFASVPGADTGHPLICP